MCQLYSYCLPDLVHRGAEGLVLVKLNCPRKPFMVVFVYFKATDAGKKLLNSWTVQFQMQMPYIKVIKVRCTGQECMFKCVRQLFIAPFLLPILVYKVYFLHKYKTFFNWIYDVCLGQASCISFLLIIL